MGRADVARPRTVCCAIPIARSAAKVLLITSRKRPHQWVLPKGGWETTDATLEAAACREAFEEAGVQGKITRTVTSIPGPTANYHFFELDVVALADRWDEASERRREWVDFSEALRRVTWKPELAEALMLCSLAPPPRR
ncbi:hypothetical protein RSOLAG22IIIB_03602 [Rhizoctonia solani]|uniref:Nudix hydrolase domain-containing protein n=1 Tax=Rhizoctonia solani TaxID=456999 RepID=A0A0K6FQU2_9AGAM|nr:hypothetical protein RSOLAG22IIIB_03602 [Rhizoctonia solani]